MGLVEHLPATTTRVEQQGPADATRLIRERSDAMVMQLEDAPPGEVEARLRRLEREWDIERVLQTNASILALSGLALGLGVHRRFLLLPGAVFGFLLQHALQGWCPPVPVFRHLGVRTVREIERERHALKTLRGDFDDVPAEGQAPVRERVRAALAAVDA